MSVVEQVMVAQHSGSRSKRVMSSSSDWAIYSETVSKTYRVAIPTQTMHLALREEWTPATSELSYVSRELWFWSEL